MFKIYWIIVFIFIVFFHINETKASECDPVKVVKNVNVREQANKFSTKVGYLEVGQSYNVVNEENGWINFWYDGQLRWSYKNGYLENAELSCVKIYNTKTDAVNVRSEPSKYSERLGKAPEGSTWILVNENNSWGEVWYDSKPAFIHSNYLEEIPKVTEKINMEVTMGYNNGYYGDSIDDSESLFDDMLVFINGDFVGEMVDTVNITLNVDPTIKNTISLIGKVSSFGEVTLTEENYQTNSVYIPLNENHGYAEWANMSVSSITENTIDKNFSSFDISFSHNELPIDIDENPSFIIELARVDGREINLEKQPSVDISHYFHVVDGILTPKSFDEFKSFFRSRAIFGELTLMVSARGKEVDVDYYGEINFYMDAFLLGGKLNPPPSNSNVSVANVEIEFSYLLNNKKLVKKVITDELGSFSIKLSFGNWSFSTEAVHDGKKYFSVGTITTDYEHSNIDVNLLTDVDIREKVPFFTMPNTLSSENDLLDFEKDKNYYERSDFEQSVDLCGRNFIERGYLFKCSHSEPLKEESENVKSSNASNESETIQVNSSEENLVVSDSLELLVPQGSKKLTVNQYLYTQEYPYYVKKQSAYNDTVAVYVYSYLSGVLYEYISEVNSIYNDFPTWDSQGVAFYRYTVDVESYAKYDNFPVSLYIETKNVGDSKRNTYVAANLAYDSPYIRVRNLQLKRNKKATKNSEDTSDFFSIPKSGDANYYHKSVDIELEIPEGYKLSNLDVILVLPDETEMQSVFSGSNFTQVGDTVEGLKLTDFVSQLSDTTFFSEFKYKFFAEAENEIDPSVIIQSEIYYSKIFQPLWKVDSITPRFGVRDAGGDGWSSYNTINWLQSYGNLVPEINDISGEHGRYIGHKTHKVGTDIDAFLFHNMIGGRLDIRGKARANYQLLEKYVINALNGDAYSIDQVRLWVTKSRAGLEELAQLSSVIKLYYTKGYSMHQAGINLSSGWGRTLIETGKLDASGKVLDLGLSPWSNYKVTYNNVHNDHLHIKLTK